LVFPCFELKVSEAAFHLSLIQLPGGGKSESDPRTLVHAAERETQARALGRQQGELESRTKFEEQLGRERAAVVAALADFSRERAAYYHKIEEEAVRLALSIARKILHREEQVD